MFEKNGFIIFFVFVSKLKNPPVRNFIPRLVKIRKRETHYPPNHASQLLNEATKHCNTQYHKSKLTKISKKAAQELNEHPDILIKKAEKSSSYVIKSNTPINC